MASAQSCIPCRDCRTTTCYRQCRVQCPVQQVDGDKCRRLGLQYGRDAAAQEFAEACQTTEQFCNGGTQTYLASSTSTSVGRATLQQCASIAYGACQDVGLNPHNSPCGTSLSSGFRQCSAQKFTDVYRAKTDEFCYLLAKAIAP